MAIKKNKDGSDKTLMQLLYDGLADCIGFAGGAFLCYWFGKLVGFDMAMAGNTSSAGIVTIMIMLICGGFGLRLARMHRASQ
jgi:low affinity Fe/Cu permease